MALIKKKKRKSTWVKRTPLEELEYLENSIFFIEKEMNFYKKTYGDDNEHAKDLKNILKKTRTKITKIKNAFNNIEKED